MGTKVRVLADSQVEGITYKPNQVVDFPAGVAKQLVAAGNADASAEAIAYCTDELHAEVIVHKAPKAEDAAAQQTETQQ